MVCSAEPTDVTGCHPRAKYSCTMVAAELTRDNSNVKMPATDTGVLRTGHGSRVLYGLSADAFTVYYQCSESIRIIRKLNAKWMSAIVNNATAVPIARRRNHARNVMCDDRFTEKIPISAGI